MDTDTLTIQERRLIKAVDRALRGGQPATATPNDWLNALVHFDYGCCVCGQSDTPLTIDHWQAIVKGGGTTADNLVPMCLECNQTKGDKHPYRFLVCRYGATHGKPYARNIFQRIERYLANVRKQETQMLNETAANRLKLGNVITYCHRSETYFVMRGHHFLDMVQRTTNAQLFEQIHNWVKNWQIVKSDDLRIVYKLTE